LFGRGLATAALRWPGETSPHSRTPDQQLPFDAGLMISDLDRPVRLRMAIHVLGEVPAPWLVLTGAPRGPLWGAALQAGARTVMASSASLDHVLTMLERVAAGQDPAPPGEHAELVAAWERVRQENASIRARVQTLTPREWEVLLLLYDGEPVPRISALLEISPATVRSQVKAVLRKLEVNSQLAAVAAVGHLMDLDGIDGPIGPVRS
jgi:DNA-binding NarL/FixJ family response regulator